MKKFLVLLTAMVFTAPAFANFTHYGKIVFQSASTYVPGNKVCQMDGFLYHKTKTAVVFECLPKDGCEGSYSKPLIQPIESNQTFCVKETKELCLETAVSAFDQYSVQVDVYKTEQDWDKNKRPINSYEYMIEHCHAEEY